MNKRAVGTDIEGIACNFLIDNRATIIERNFRSRQGEIDIIARDEGYLCFIEVKFRTNDRYGQAVEAVNIKKQIHICRVSKFYLYSKYKSFDLPVRYDVIAISQIEDRYSINWIKNAFDYIE